MNTRHWILAAGRTLAGLACGITVSVAAQAAALPPCADSLGTLLAGVENIQAPYPWLLTGGQPDAKALATIAETGAWDIVDMRTADEPRGFDEKATASVLGLRYLPIPTNATGFSDSRFTAFRHHLIAHGPQRPLFVHCASGNRVGAALLPWLVLDQGLKEGAALDMAREMGLRDLDMTRIAQEYIRAHRLPAPMVK